MQEEIAKGNVVFGPDETTIPSVRRNLFDKDEQVMRSVMFSYAQKASQDFAAIFGGLRVFDNPKNYLDIKKIIEYLSAPGDTILDFFAGSGTTAHATMLSNANTSSTVSRRYISVQLPEPVNPKTEAGRNALSLGLTTVFAIAVDRVRRVRENIRTDALGVADLGFRVFKLDSSNIRAWEPDTEDIEHTLESSVEHLKAGRTEQDVLYELLLKMGLDLAVPIERSEIAGKTVYSVGAGTLLVCLATGIARDEAEPLALGIASWHGNLAPEGESHAVFRDSAFADDVAKTNLSAILHQHGIEHVRSI
jgi:adenine-specific DNA-methyltransferase